MVQNPSPSNFTWTLGDITQKSKEIWNGLCIVAVETTINIHKTPSFENGNDMGAADSSADNMVFDTETLLTMGSNILDTGESYGLSEFFDTENKVLLKRYFTGYGDEKGGLSIVVENHSEYDLPEVVYFDSYPWFMRIWMHSLQLKRSNIDRDMKSENLFDSNASRNLTYIHSIVRNRPWVFEFSLFLPAKTRTIIHFEFDKMLLRYTEYPPDALRGFDIA